MKLIKAETKKQYARIRKLYKTAFPVQERKLFWLIKQKQKQGLVDIWMLEQNQEFAGLAITMKNKDLVLLDYFAIAQNQRASGQGSKALKCLLKYYEKKRFFLEIESTLGKAKNQKERERRKHFYLKNGMTEIGMVADVFGINMELLGYDCGLTFEEYISVYRNAYGRRKAKRLKRVPI